MIAEAELDLPGLERLAVRTWHELALGATVWLSGDLGTGKTTFVRAVTNAAGAPPATSPTYALVNAYPSPSGSIIHVDCYRLNDEDEAIDIDFAELSRNARALFIEWPERAGRHAPPPDRHFEFTHGTSHAIRRVSWRT